MPTPDEIARIAGAMNQIRPDWPVNSLRSFLTNNHASRAYRDLMVAGVVVALDEKTETPRLLNQNGPWWVAAQRAGGTYTDIHFARCPEPGHTSYPAHNCGACRTEALESTTETEVVDRGEAYEKGAALVRAALGRKS